MNPPHVRAYTNQFSKWLHEEKGGVPFRDAPLSVTLAYPSPYEVAMSSLGYLWIFRRLQARSGISVERAVLPSAEHKAFLKQNGQPVLSLERHRPLYNADVIAFSQSYELELAGVAEMLSMSRIPPAADERDASYPLIILGGPITFSNPMPSGFLADVIILGEAENAFDQVLDLLEATPEAAKGSDFAREAFLHAAAAIPGVWIPKLDPNRLPKIAKAAFEDLPAYSTLRTPNTELSDRVLIEPERGCHRGCTFCVMRRSTNDGMRPFEVQRVLDRIPEDAARIGLVGAAVTDHPHIKELLKTLVLERQMNVGISSLRADRLDDEFVKLLSLGGYRSLTIALDAASVRLRDAIEKNIRDRHIENVVELARRYSMKHVKLYVIVGLPDETDEDRNELIEFCLRLSKTIPIVLAVSPFVPKFQTPLADTKFVGEEKVDQILRKLRSSFKGTRVEMRGPGAREAYIEARLSQGDRAMGQVAIEVAARGSSLSSWKQVLKNAKDAQRPLNFSDLVKQPTLRKGRLSVLRAQSV